MKDVLYIVLGLAAAAVGVWQMISFINVPTSKQNYLNLIFSIVCFLIAIVFVGLFFSGRVNKEEEIHITK